MLGHSAVQGRAGKIRRASTIAMPVSNSSQPSKGMASVSGFNLDLNIACLAGRRARLGLVEQEPITLHGEGNVGQM